MRLRQPQVDKSPLLLYPTGQSPFDSCPGIDECCDLGSVVAAIGKRLYRLRLGAASESTPEPGNEGREHLQSDLLSGRSTVVTLLHVNAA